MLNQQHLRKAGSLAFFELRKYPFYNIKETDNKTVISLFGDTYKFTIDRDRKISFMESNHHYAKSNTFRLMSQHKDWHGIFSFPREITYKKIMSHLLVEGCKPEGATEAKRVGIDAKIVANQVYHLDKQKMGRIFGGVLWKQHDPELASLAVKIHGITANSLDYTVIWNNKEEVLDTLKKAPGVLPIWRNLVALKMCMNRKKQLTPKRKPTNFVALLNNELDEDWSDVDNLVNGRTNEDYPAMMLSDLKYAEEVDNFVFPDIIDTTKKYLEKNGITPAGWRYLTKLPSRFAHIIVNRMPMRSIVPCINWLATIGVVPRYSLMKNIVNMHAYGDEVIGMMRAAFTHASKMRRGVRTFYEDELQLVVDWFCEGGRPRALDNNQRRANWSWFMRQQEEWHARMHAEGGERAAEENARAKEKKINETWTSLVEEFEYKEYRIKPLVSTYDLIDEGEDMRHCVGGYTRQCKSNMSRIFSIMKNGRKVATLELSKSYMDGEFGSAPGKWTVHQCRGKGNSTVSEVIKKVAEHVKTKYSKAYLQHWKMQEREVIAS